MSRLARKVAREIVRDIDKEGKYVPRATYEVTGRNLVEYLAYAFERGQKCGETTALVLGRGLSK